MGKEETGKRNIRQFIGVSRQLGHAPLLSSISPRCVRAPLLTNKKFPDGSRETPEKP